MKKNLSVVILVYFLIHISGCIPGYFVGSKIVKYGSTIEVLEKGAKSTIEYKGYDILYNELMSKANVQMWDEKKINQEITSIPRGGYVVVTFNASTIGAANTKYWEYVIKNLKGEEIVRKKGADVIPEFTATEYGTNWWNIEIVYINDKVTEPFNVYVIDKLMNRRDTFKVYPNEIIR